MSANPFLGAISLYGISFAPRDWAFCGGQLLSISSNQALFALIGTIYGGNGRVTFSLPDTLGRAVIGPDTNSGRTLGSKSGQESVTLTPNELPAHEHGIFIPVSEDTNGSGADQNTGYLQRPATGNFYSTTAGSGTLMSSKLQPTGGNHGHENRQPYIALNYCIALQGVFPSRS